MDYNYELRILNSPFDVKKHKEVFIDYLEVVIFPDGKIEYAVPSHSEKIYQIYMKKHNLSRTELYNKMIKNNLCVTDLASELRIILVWKNKFICNFIPTQMQCNSIDILKKNNLLKVDENDETKYK